ncbi:isomerase [Devosia yakushimensis]|uniref:Isomerase n=1 Tax=Devosia yakushimensis TaxID=470028 RepID=A0ABQ5UAL1_9HYPH|nr:PhzF family phenazine biosynthesis protein [Devosia yakushimensis]GLQ08939.1 isomerase [Devosia yakushimensis]
MKLNYLLLDVFTRHRLKGNPLAVVLKADGLLDGEMQAIANEFNLSETIFILKPQAERNTASVRIFTPHTELPFAGHPTIGATVALGLQHKASVMRIEEQVGLITALFERVDKRTGEARFALPQLPEPAGQSGEIRDMALALGIEGEDIGCGDLRPAVFSAGNLFHLVPVHDAGVLARIRVNDGHWQQAFPHGRHAVYIFTRTPEEPGNDFAARMLKPGSPEDPGTGSAAAALIGLLAEHAEFTTGQADYILRQGHEMGRPCTITLQLRKDNGVLVHGGIGGHAVITGEGVLDLGD